MGPQDVLAFWFGAGWPEEPPSEACRQRWWKKSKAFDEEIRQRFGDTHAEASAGKLAHWADTPSGCLALVIVLDQFSRNLHRDDPRAWAADATAQRYARAAVDRGADRDLPPHGRAFLYMPFMHAEDRDLQAHSCALFETLGKDHPELAAISKYAVQHREIVDRFGRFPHRNAALGRASTPEELEFLKEPGSSF
jgi:uncharacterized protein (DUF924 family)